MELIHERVAGLDVHRDEVAACVRTAGPRRGVHVEKARFKTTTGGLAVLAHWLADVAAHGMVRPSFVPPPAVRELRVLTRYRQSRPGSAPVRSRGWRRCSRTPGSSSPPSPPRCSPNQGGR